MTNRHRDLSLKRSEFAWKCATKAEKKLKGNYKEYVTLVKNVPTSLSNNGLGQTLAFLNSKPNSESYKLLFEQLEKWLKSEIYLTSADAENKSIIVWIQTGEVDWYRRAAREAMEFITWLKLHSSSLNIKVDSDNDSKKVDTKNLDAPTPASKTDKETENVLDDPETTTKSLEETK